jgi:hypothetical protein
MSKILPSGLLAKAYSTCAFCAYCAHARTATLRKYALNWLSNKYYWRNISIRCMYVKIAPIHQRTPCTSSCSHVSATVTYEGCLMMWQDRQQRLRPFHYESQPMEASL